MNAPEFSTSLSNFYRDPSPSRATEELVFITQANWSELADLDIAGNAPNLAYHFARFAETHPSVVADYEKLLSLASADGRRFLLAVLLLTSAGGTPDHLERFPTSELTAAQQLASQVKFSVLRDGVDTIGDLDLLWTEFSTTGDVAAIARIVDVLDRADRTRDRLEVWLQSRPTLPFLAQLWTSSRRATQEKLQEQLGILCDVKRRILMTGEDLDCLCVLHDLEISRAKERFHATTIVLPFRISSDDKQYMATKAAALWSLGSNATQHDRVLEHCRAELARRSGRARLGLLRVVAQGLVNHGDDQSAVASYQEYLTVDPHNRFVGHHLSKARCRLELPRLRRLSAAAAPGDSPIVGDATTVAQRCIDTTSQAASYRCWRFIKDRTQLKMAARDFVILEYEFEFVGPDRSHVNQAAWPDDPEHGDYDEWIDMKSLHYQNAGLWLGPSRHPDPPVSDINSSLKVNTLLAVMRQWPPLDAVTCESNDRGYIRLNLDTSRPGNDDTSKVSFFPVSDTWHGTRAATIWLEADTGRLVKGEFRLQGQSESDDPVDLEVEQIYLGYDDPILIEPPVVNVSPTS